VWREQPEQRGLEHEQERGQPPDRVQDHLAAQVVADLDPLLVLVGRLVLLVVALGLEQKVADLTDAHREDPAEQRGEDRLREQQHVGRDEAARADEVQGLVDAAVMVEAVIIPTLLLELFEETVHGASLVQKPYHRLVTDLTF
jgi:hypothetical protein